jgi:hypothetical protein
VVAQESLSKEWIEKQRTRYRKVDPLLIERQIRSFALVCLLIQSGRPFVFKGGTALILLLPVARRLSIDVDVVGDFTFDQLTAQVKGSCFQRVEEHERENRGIPKRHFKFYYTSVVDGRESYVLLDVLYGPHGYPAVTALPVANDLFAMEEGVSVTTPTLNCMAGDKLTAFAPHTLGVPFGKERSMEIIKQIFDIGEIFNHITDIAEVSAAYSAISTLENGYRGKTYTQDQALDDTAGAAFLLSQASFKGSVDNDELREMLTGIRQLTGYFLGTKFTIDEARVAAAKAAVLSTILKRGGKERVAELQYSSASILQIKDVLLDGRFRVLNKLKSTNPESFYYWWLVAGMNPVLKNCVGEMYAEGRVWEDSVGRHAREPPAEIVRGRCRPLLCWCSMVL